MSDKQGGGFLLFAGHHYYPEGGIDDLKASGTIEECKAFFDTHRREIADGYVLNWGQIVRASDLAVMLRGEVKYDGAPVWREPDAAEDEQASSGGANLPPSGYTWEIPEETMGISIVYGGGGGTEKNPPPATGGQK